MFRKKPTMTGTLSQQLHQKLAKFIQFSVCSLLLSTFATGALAQGSTGTLKNTSYNMSVGDVNGDGREDILMKAVPRIVPIPLDDDLTIPLVIPPKVPSFALMSDAYWGYVLVPNPDAQLLQSNWSAASSSALQFGANGQYADTVRITGAVGEFVVALSDVSNQLSLVQLPGVSKAPGTVTYIHTDGLGSPAARTNAAGQMVSRTLYEPYGYVAAGATPTIGFTGHVNDADTGLTYMQQRYYDPVAGRFLSIDPVVTDVDSGSSFNRYSYAINNPYGYVDPDGRDSEKPIVVEVKAKREPKSPPLPPDPPTQKAEPKREPTFVINDPPLQGIHPECAIPVVRYFCGAAAVGGGALGVKGVKGVRRKPGSLGQPKGTDALRRENEQARAVDKELGLPPGTTHREISGEGFSGYSEILQYMKDSGYGKK